MAYWHLIEIENRRRTDERDTLAHIENDIRDEKNSIKKELHLSVYSVLSCLFPIDLQYIESNDYRSSSASEHKNNTTNTLCTRTGMWAGASDVYLESVKKKKNEKREIVHIRNAMMMNDWYMRCGMASTCAN